jgi:hypothetical protein
MIILKNFTGWKYYKDIDGNNIGIEIRNQDGSQESRGLFDSEVKQWLAEGNTPLPADE